MAEDIRINKKDDWDGNEDRLSLEYHYHFIYDDKDFNLKDRNEDSVQNNEDFNYVADKLDYKIAASIGLITGMLDVFWTKEFSIEDEVNWGSDKVNAFVVFVARKKGFEGNDLQSAIRFLEDNAKIPSDELTAKFGGGTKHHFRDFAHHPSIVGLMFSLLTQFTKKCYGVDENGNFKCEPIDSDKHIGKDFYSKVINGTFKWFLHLVSDMAGSSKNPGKGTGIPGPIISMALELVSILHLNELKLSSISIYERLEIIFEGKDNDEKNRFDLRAEFGLANPFAKQSLPVVLNRCLLKTFYIIKCFYKYLNDNKIDKLDLLSVSDYYSSIKYDSKCYIRMCTISSGVFSVVDFSDALIKCRLTEKDKSVFGFATRINFVGLLSFVIAVKNDITYSINEYLTHKEKLLVNSESIEIQLIYNYDELYNSTFNNICQNIINSKLSAIKTQRLLGRCEKRIISLKDNYSRIFDQIVDNDNSLNEISSLMMKLLKNKQVPFVPIDNRSNSYFVRPFYIVENGEKVVFYFSNTIWTARRLDYDSYKDDLEEFDFIKVVAIVDLYSDRQNGDDDNDIICNGEEVIINDIDKSLKYLDGINEVKDKVERISIRSFIYRFFGEEEYLKFRHKIVSLNEKIRRLIGVKTVEIPTDETKKAFKEYCEKTILNFEYKEMFNGINQAQQELISANYIKNKNYLYILGDNSFSDSFISSEWYFNNYTATDGIEQTAIISGYLKSIEQLLYEISLLSIEKGYKIKKKNNKELIDFTYENLKDDNIDITFGSLINYIDHNYSIWNVNRYVKRYIINKLDNYRKKYRNDHFHKDNIFVLDEIKDIRKETVSLYCLLMGGINIDGNEFLIYDKNEHCDYEKEFIEWVDKLIGGNNFIDPKVELLFSVLGNEIYLYAYEGYRGEHVPNLEKCKKISGTNSFKFSKADFDLIISSVEGWIAYYFIVGKYKDLFMLHENILLFTNIKGMVRIDEIKV